MKLKDLIDKSLLVEKKLSKHKKELIANKKKPKKEKKEPISNKKPKEVTEGNKKKDGRKRLVSAVYNKLKEMGAEANKQEVKNYVVHMYKLWDRKSKEVQWILDLEKRAIELGFNPREYKDQEPGDSAGGIGAPGGEEYDGRAFFFVALTEKFAQHFVDKYNKHHKKEN